MSIITFPHIHPRNLELFNSTNVLHISFPCCTKLTQWEPPPVKYALTETATNNLLEKTTNIFETLSSENTDEVPVTSAKELTDTSNQPVVQPQFLKWLTLLLPTGMVPNLWLPISSIFLGSNVASLLSLIAFSIWVQPFFSSWPIPVPAQSTNSGKQKGLKPGVELGAPEWIMHVIRRLVGVLVGADSRHTADEGGLVCWFHCSRSSATVFFCW